MRLVHTVIPFLSDDSCQSLPHHDQTVLLQAYPNPESSWVAPEMDQRFMLLEQTIGLVRTSRVLLNYPPAQQIMFYVAHDEPRRQDYLHELQRYLAHLGRGTVDLTPTTRWPTSN